MKLIDGICTMILVLLLLILFICMVGNKESHRIDELERKVEHLEKYNEPKPENPN